VLYAVQQRTRRKLRECTARRFTFGKRAKSSPKSHKTFWTSIIASRIGAAMLQSLMSKLRSINSTLRSWLDGMGGDRNNNFTFESDCHHSLSNILPATVSLVQ
jgi:hypothetical protein